MTNKPKATLSQQSYFLPVNNSIPLPLQDGRPIENTLDIGG
jgi:hypothetical protein